ncbi:MAG: domain containing protein [Parcubacteria group bacterium]|nr:domain containing protein [Parcubacteria group bacterium]
MAKVIGLYIAPERKMSMQARAQVHAVAGHGLEGDRYNNAAGQRPQDRRFSDAAKLRGATFNACEDIEAANRWLRDRGHPSFSAAETRRNVLLTGFTDFASLIGREFWAGAAKFRGVELADPCVFPSKLAGGKFGFMEAFEGRGGLRAEVVSGGLIKLGSPFQI